MSEINYRIIFPKTEVMFEKSSLTFTINHIKSRYLSTLYFILHCFDKYDTEIFTYTSPRWVITTEYTTKTRTFELGNDLFDDIAYTQIELRTANITSENPLYFNQIMFNEGEYEEYSIPYAQIKNADVYCNNTRYVNMYDNTGNYLQVIRPNGEPLKSDCLSKSPCTVIAPHLEGETDVDDPINIFMEFINQKDQRIDVLR